jgi:hypothetical protein
VLGDREWSSSQVDVCSRQDSDCDLQEEPHFKQIQGLYKIIEELIVRAIPQWDLTLGPLEEHNNRSRINVAKVKSNLTQTR